MVGPPIIYTWFGPECRNELHERCPRGPCECHCHRRCPTCDATCVSCAARAPELDTPYGPLCGWCVGNGQAEPYTEQCDPHEHGEVGQ